MEMEQHREASMSMSISKHVCKFCSRRFACGRALGGHMRIHGSASASEFVARGGEDYQYGDKRRRVSEAQTKNGVKQREKEEEEDDEEDEASCDNDLNKSNNPMYDLRPNRRRSWRYADVDYSFMVPAIAGDEDELGSKFIKDFQMCEKCGNEFSSSAALIAHIRCHHMKDVEEEEEDEGNESDDFKEQGKYFYWDSESDTETVRAAVNSEKRIKGKRSARPRQRAEALEPLTPEVEYVANCLVMLSSSGESWEQPRKQKKHADVVQCSAKMDLKHPSSRKRRRASPSNNNSSIGSGNVQSESVKPPAKKIKYECKTCKKMFQSFQALGGHRASHNKYKGCSAKQEEEELVDNENLEEEIITSDEDLSKGDDLSKSTPNKTGDSCDEGNESMAAGEEIKKGDVCLKTFSSGEVVGGYWVATSSNQKHSPWLDLNLPAPDEDSPPKKWSEKQVVFSDAESSDRDNLTAEAAACRPH